ncbi:hypothetical protein LX36DRAFT_662942 [Colletotrichum falcatum]|nr:hypothetical protein LX36DRAFT_662942 [Colletotrichum falcatum]
MQFLNVLLLAASIGFAAATPNEAQTVKGNCQQGNTLFCGPSVSQDMRNVHITAEDTTANEASCQGLTFQDPCNFNFHTIN